MDQEKQSQEKQLKALLDDYKVALGDRVRMGNELELLGIQLRALGAALISTHELVLSMRRVVERGLSRDDNQEEGAPVTMAAAEGRLEESPGATVEAAVEQLAAVIARRTKRVVVSQRSDTDASQRSDTDAGGITR